MIPLNLPSGPLSVLCLGAHPDDIEIGCGATILALAASGRATGTHVMFTGTPERQDEARRGAELFWDGAPEKPVLVNHAYADGRLPAVWNDVKDALEAVARETGRPDLVLAPRTDDLHQDHRLIGKLVPTVWRNSLVLHYEIPKWDGDMYPVTHFVPVAREDAVRKVRLLDEAYPSQQGHDWWDAETYLGLMRLRGVECRSTYAEGFVSPKTLLGFAGFPDAPERAGRP
jgi:LmbE family N-acetylglucosaminyl deacetylase